MKKINLRGVDGLGYLFLAVAFWVGFFYVVHLFYHPHPTAICSDGHLSYSAHYSGTCSWHGGVKRWITSASENATANDDDGDHHYVPADDSDER